MPPPMHPLAGTLSVLVCDSCDAVLDPAAKMTASKKHADSDPSDLAPHYESKPELTIIATRLGWRQNGERWSCPDCITRR